jgi:cytochrome c5
MRQEDKQFMTQFMIVLGALVAFTVVMFFVARFLMAVNTPDEEAYVQRYEDDRLKPIGKVAAGKAPAGQAAPKAAAGGGQQAAKAGGQQIYSQACSQCHDTGTMGAPKITAKSAWQSRLAQGKQTLYQHAISGFGAMPPKGGDPSLSDVHVKAAVDYIVAQVSGGGGGKQVAAKAQAGAGKKAAAAELAKTVSTPEGKSTYQIMCSSCHDSGVLGAPKITDKAAWQPRIAQGMQALYSSAISGLGAMPPKGGHPQLSEKQVQAAVDYIVSTVISGGAAQGTQPAKPSAKGDNRQPKASQGAQPGAKAQAGAGKKMADAKIAARTTSTSEGKSTYQIMCATCHDSGALGAPKITDKAAWQARIAKGKQALYTSALSGIGAMPPKGGHPQLSDKDVEAAVDYIVNQVQ